MTLRRTFLPLGCLWVALRSKPPRAARARGGRVSAVALRNLSDFLRRQRSDGIDVRLVDEGAGGVHVEAGEAELLREADIEDRQIALEEGLLVDDQGLIALLHRLGRVGRHVEAREEHLARLQRG